MHLASIFVRTSRQANLEEKEQQKFSRFSSFALYLSLLLGSLWSSMSEL